MRFMAEDGFPPEQITNHDDGSLTVKASIPIGEWTLGWLLSLGEHIEVVRPPYLRQMMKEKSAAILGLYT
jgi:predicted DNA-binding transcriptional regulator YafY